MAYHININNNGVKSQREIMSKAKAAYGANSMKYCRQPASKESGSNMAWNGWR
jgi:hypothetical protein